MNQPEVIPRHRKGDSWNGMLLTWKDDDNIPIDMTGFVVKCDFKENPIGQAAMSWSTENLTITVNSIGQIRFLGRKIEVTAKRYLADVEVTNPSGYTQTIADFIWEIHQDITQ